MRKVGPRRVTFLLVVTGIYQADDFTYPDQMIPHVLAYIPFCYGKPNLVTLSLDLVTSDLA